MAEQKKTKVKRKQWCQILAPKLFREQTIGETLLYEPSAFMGRKIKVNLMQLTGDIKKQSVKVMFKANGTRGENILTEVIGYEVAQPSIKRMVRRNRDRIDLSFVCSTSDNKKVRIKPLLLTRSQTKGSVQTALHKTLINTIMKNVQKIHYENLVQDLISFKFQNSMRDELKKIYPLKIFAIKSLSLEKERIGKAKEESKKVEEKPEEEKTEVEEKKVEEKSKSEEKPKKEKAAEESIHENSLG